MCMYVHVCVCADLMATRCIGGHAHVLVDVMDAADDDGEDDEAAAVTSSAPGVGLALLDALDFLRLLVGASEFDVVWYCEHEGR